MERMHNVAELDLNSCNPNSLASGINVVPGLKTSTGEKFVLQQSFAFDRVSFAEALHVLPVSNVRLEPCILRRRASLLGHGLGLADCLLCFLISILFLALRL
jgi:hypothetical protein